MDNFKFNFLSRGQLESLNLHRIFFTFIQNITMLRGFFGNLIFAINARMLSGNHLNKEIKEKNKEIPSGKILSEGRKGQKLLSAFAKWHFRHKSFFFIEN